MVLSVYYEFSGELDYHGCGADGLSWTYSKKTLKQLAAYKCADNINCTTTIITDLLNSLTDKIPSNGLAIIDFKHRHLKIISDRQIQTHRF